MHKRSLLLALVLVPLIGLVSCIFDSSGTSSYTSWLQDNGFPANYKVETLQIDAVPTVSSSVGFDSTPVKQLYRATLGNVPGTTQSLLFDIAFRDSSFLANARATGVEPTMSLRLRTDSIFYATHYSGSYPLSDSLQVRYSWRLDAGHGSSFIDSVGEITDSVWLATWRDTAVPNDSADTAFTWSIAAALDSFDLPIPSKLAKAFVAVTDAQHLQLKIQLVGGNRMLRVRSLNWSTVSIPRFILNAGSLTKNVYSFRLAQQTRLTEDACTSCLMLHGGIRESLVVEFDAAPIMDALRKHYGDDFPLNDSAMDVRQTVVMAQIAVPRSSSTDGSELGLPVPVFAYSLLDSLKGDGSYSQYTEGYKLDSADIATNGHPNLLYYPGDTLKLQISKALRHYINTAAVQGQSSFRVVLRMGRPMLSPKDTYYYDHTDSDGNTVRIFSDNAAFARYDFASVFAKGTPVRMKLWITSTREADQ